MADTGVKPLERSDAAPMRPPPVVVVESATSTTFSYANGIAVGVRMLFVMPAIILAMFVLMAVTRERGFGSPFWVMVSIQFVMIGLICGGVIFRRHTDWRKDCDAHRAAADDVDPHDPSWIVKDALLEVGGLCRVNWWNGRVDPRWRDRFQQILHKRGLPQNMVIIQKEIADRLRAIPIDERFVEPERLLGEIPRRSGTFWVFTVLALYMVWLTVSSALWGDWIMTAVFAVSAAMIGVQLLRSWGIHVSQANAPMMGLGVISDHKGRIWSVRDSVVYLYPWKAGFQSNILVSVIGPAGYHALQFHGLEDPGLIMFWQRWMHPHPRPDLVQ